MNWKIVKNKSLYDGHFKVDQLVIQHELFAGGLSANLTRERVSRKNSVAVLPYDPVRDEVVLVEQFRVGALSSEQQESSPWLIEIIAGLVEEGEAFEEVACREALEEANCKVKNLLKVSSFFPSPGGFSELSHVYIGRTDTTNLGGICGLKEEGEDIRVHVMSSDNALQLLQAGKIRSAIPMIALYNFMQLRDKLIKQWSQ